MEPRDLDRVLAIYRSIRDGTVTADEKRELRAICSYYSERALELPWDGLVEVADYVAAAHGTAEAAV